MAKPVRLTLSRRKGFNLQATSRAKAREVLAGSNLACWCAPGTPCHAAILLELVNPAA